MAQTPPLDRSNTVTPMLTAITNVTLDHEAHLGATVAAIAYEKAGIVKPGVPVVLGNLAPEAGVVVERTAAQCASGGTCACPEIP